MYLLSMNPILSLCAIFPAVYLMVKVYKADKIEKEPIGFLLILVLSGIFSTSVAVFFEEIGTRILSLFFRENSLIYRAILYFIIVGCSEEGAKYLLLKKATWKSRNFNYLFDGVVYAVFVSLGFALWENIGYVAKFGLANALVRAVTAVPGHACFGVFMGVYYGLSKLYANRQNPIMSENCRKKALIFPVVMHGIYDFLATSTLRFAGLYFTLYIIFMFLLAVALVKKISSEDENIEDVNRNIFDDFTGE